MRVADRSAPTWRMLDAFSLDEVPLFSRTVLTSSPVLVLPHRDGTPIEAGSSFRGSFVSSSNANPPVSLVRQSSSFGSTTSEAEEFPLVLQLLVRLHKREAFNMFKTWESNGVTAVPLDAFAEAVRNISGERLTDDELLSVLKIIEPVRGDEVLVGEYWRSRTLDCKRLWRKLSSIASRASSQYIRDSHSRRSPPAALAPLRLGNRGSPQKAASWAAMLEERSASTNGSPAGASVLEDAPLSAALAPKSPKLETLAESESSR